MDFRRLLVRSIALVRSLFVLHFFFFKQKTAYEIKECDWSSDVCSSDLRGVIEIAPLAFMRGRTLNDSFVILDEAQNTTTEQMKMFLTRLGFDSKAVITGDITQIDLPVRTSSGDRKSTRLNSSHIPLSRMPSSA